MEFHTKTVSNAYFEKPTPETVVTSVKYSLNGGPQTALVASEDNSGTFVKLPYFSTEGDLTLTWGFVIPGSGSHTDTQYHQIVTPYLTLKEVKAIYPQASDEEAREVEAAVRHVINAHTGQSFGLAVKTLTVEGHGESALRLPERLLEITGLSTLTAGLNIRRAIITSDGWYLKKGWSDSVTAIESTDEYWGGGADTVPANDHDDDGIWTLPVPGEPGYEKSGHGPIISAPNVSGRTTPWRDDYPFKITGKWGYISVPAPVKEAAKLLVNDYACSEQLYRDRYLESVKAADWRLQFSSRAWDYTGNVRADQLLSQYVLLDWAVV